MSSETIAGRGQPRPTGHIDPKMLASPHPPVREQRISRGFQLLLGIYIIVTGDFPTVVQAVAFGLPAGSAAEFTIAVVTSFAYDLLLLLPVIVLASHPLGILHPLLLAVVVWPLVTGMPHVIEQFGGWASVFSAEPVQSPFFAGLPSRDPTTVWTAIAKHNGIQMVALVSTYVGFLLLRAKRNIVRRPRIPVNSASLRTVLLGLFTLSMIVLLVFLYFRGGLAQHLTSLGGGRFRELAGMGPVLVVTNLGAIALYVWIAARPADIKSPLFLFCLATATVSQFAGTGSRGSALMVPLFVGLMWSLRRQSVPWKTALLILPVMFVSIGFMGTIRTSSWYGSSAGEAFFSTGWSDSVTRAQQELADRRAFSADVPIVERGFQVTGGPLLGQSYLAAATALVPRAMWEEKPRGVGSLYAQTFLGAPREGLGVPVSPGVEMYWNFGIAGVVILSILYGLLLRLVYRFFLARYPDPFVIVAYALFVTRFGFGTKSLVEFQQVAALLLVTLLAVKMFVPRALPGTRSTEGAFRIRPVPSVR